MNIIWVTALSLGFLSSLHCVGMCGPIVMALPLNRSSIWTMLGGLLLNNISRSFGYALMGMLAGIFGKGLAIAGLQNKLSILAGVLMLLLLFFSSKLVTSKFMHGINSKWKMFAIKIFGISSPYTLSLIGFLNAFLPCGFVYMALAGALSTGNILSGSIFMMLFGAGTFPALIMVAFAGQFLKPRVRSWARSLTPVFVSLLACILILRGMNLDIPYLSPASSQETIQTCCHK